MLDIPDTLPVGTEAVSVAWNKAVHAIRGLKAEVDNGKRTNAELTERAERQAADISDLRKAVAAAEAHAVANPVLKEADADLEFYRTEKGWRLYGADDGEGGYLPGLLDDPAPMHDWQLRVQRAATDHALASVIKGSPHNMTKKRLKAVLNAAPANVRKAFDGQVGTGAEFIPEVQLAQLIRDVEANSGDLRQLFQVINVSAQTSYLPVLTDNGRPFIVGSGSGENPANVQRTSMGTAERTLSPVGLGASVLVHDVASEDSIFTILPEVQRSLAIAMALGFDDCILNGDTSASHQDTGLASWDADGIWPSLDAGSLDHRRAFDGLRRISRAGSSTGYADHSTFNVAAITAGLAALTKPRGRNQGLTIVTSEAAMLSKFATIDNFLDASKYGNNRAVMAGEVGMLFGARCVVSDFMSEKMATTGFYTGSGAKTGWLAFNRDRFRVINRRSARIELQRNALQQGVYVVGTERNSFKLIKSSGASIVNAFYGYNL
jgi:HK97 family phage major capsid protein